MEQNSGLAPPGTLPETKPSTQKEPLPTPKTIEDNPFENKTPPTEEQKNVDDWFFDQW